MMSRPRHVRSPLKADIRQREWHVRYVQKLTLKEVGDGREDNQSKIERLLDRGQRRPCYIADANRQGPLQRRDTQCAAFPARLRSPFRPLAEEPLKKTGEKAIRGSTVICFN